MCRSVVTFHCFINPEVTDILGSSDFIGWLYRFPPVSRRRGFMTSQSDTQWVTVCLPACRRPTQLALPLSDKPLRRLWRFDASLVLEEHLKIFFDQYFHTAALCVGDFFFSPERFAGNQCSPAVCCAVLLVCVCWSCGGCCLSLVLCGACCYGLMKYYVCMVSADAAKHARLWFASVESSKALHDLIPDCAVTWF